MSQQMSPRERAWLNVGVRQWEFEKPPILCSANTLATRSMARQCRRYYRELIKAQKSKEKP